MTVTTTSNRDDTTGDGVTTVFPFTFALQQASDLDCYIAGVLTAPASVAINSNGVGGTVTFTTAPVNLAEIILIRVVDLTQESNLPSESNLDEETLEDMADKNMMAIQQVSETVTRGIRVPITAVIDGEIAIPADSELYVVRLNVTSDAFELVSAAQAFNESDPAAGGGNVIGPGSSVDYALAMFNGATGQTLRSLSTAGIAGQSLISGGVGAPPVWTSQNQLLKSGNIAASARALPTTGALTGTYVHFGNWTSTGALTFSNDVRIYLKGNMTLSHTLTGTAQSNGGIAGSNYHWGGGPGGGVGGGQGGHAIHGIAGLGGGAGGGCGGAGGRGGYNGTAAANQGGRAHGDNLAGGGGGGAGSGDLAGTNLGAAGGGGGPFIYIEVDGTITLNETISAPGTVGTVATTTGGAGGGGAGGIIYLRGSSTLTIATGKKITTTGGAGGAENVNGRGGGGGGGGIVNIWTGGAHTLPDGAATHVTATGGAAGSGTPITAPAAGGAGTTTLLASAAPISLF